MLLSCIHISEGGLEGSSPSALEKFKDSAPFGQMLATMGFVLGSPPPTFFLPVCLCAFTTNRNLLSYSACYFFHIHIPSDLYEML